MLRNLKINYSICLWNRILLFLCLSQPYFIETYWEGEEGTYQIILLNHLLSHPWHFLALIKPWCLLDLFLPLFFLLFHPERSSFIIGHLPSKTVFHQRLFPLKVVFDQRSSSIKSCLWPCLDIVIFMSKVRLSWVELWLSWGHQRTSFIYGYLPSMFVFHQSLSSINGCLPSKVVFHHMSSSIKGCFPSKVVFPHSLSSVNGCVPSKVVFHQRSSSIKGCFPSKVVLHQRLSWIKGWVPS